MSDDPLATLYCVNHPDTPTTLRCNRCEKPICPKCAVLTPTGYRCNECVRNQQKIFATAVWYDYLFTALIAGILGYLGSLLVRYVGFFTLFLAPIAGMVIAEAIRAAVRRRRSKRLFQLAALSAALGSLPILIMLLLAAFLGGSAPRFLLSIVWQGLYLVMMVSSLYYRLSGIQIGR